MTLSTYYQHFVLDGSCRTEGQKVEALLTQQLEKYLAMSLVKSFPMKDGGFIVQYTGPMDSFATVRGFPEGIVNITIENMCEEELDLILPWGTSKAMADDIAKVLGCRQYERFNFFNRSQEPRYFITYNEQSSRTVEGHIKVGLPRRAMIDLDKFIFQEKSAYQLVQISNCYLGNVLFLDGQINLAAKDSVYTETIMQRGKEDYRDKEILILGGGDGALLYQLLEEEPKFVVMVEIDESVIRACRTYLSDVNGGVLNNMKGTTHEIIIGDCFEHLNKLIEEGRKFDFVFDDVSKRPGCENEHQSTSSLSLVKKILNLSLKILKPSGKHMCHCAETARQDILNSFENLLKTLHDPVDFSTDVAFIPATYELRQFYRIWRK